MNIITTTSQFKHIQSWHDAYIPTGYALVPDTMDTTEFYQYNGCVDLTVKDETVTAITPNFTAWNAWQATLPDPDIAKAEAVRTQRDDLLTTCDWTQMADCPLDADTKMAWVEYRQNLRDVPEQAGFPNEINWPEVPA